eukprot:SAG11_NODE_78_length_17939_cov_10.236883_15_plen_172_part_00
MPSENHERSFVDVDDLADHTARQRTANSTNQRHGRARMSTPSGHPQTPAKMAQQKRSTRTSASGETFPVPAFATSAERPAFKPIKQEPTDFTDLAGTSLSRLSCARALKLFYSNLTSRVAASFKQKTTFGVLHWTRRASFRKIEAYGGRQPRHRVHRHDHHISITGNRYMY